MVMLSFIVLNFVILGVVFMVMLGAVVLNFVMLSVMQNMKSISTLPNFGQASTFDTGTYFNFSVCLTSGIIIMTHCTVQRLH